MTSTIAPAVSPFAPRPAELDGFVRADGARLVDGRGRELLLRGVGLGNWLLPEGYMWRFGPGAESPREIEALVARLAGEEYAASFWPRFREAFVTEADIARIAASGFDHVRLPINSRVIQDEEGRPIEEGYALIDALIAWCRGHRLWVLLDLHGAPGGQTGTNIDDSPHGRPDLFLEPRYRELTLALWRELARRYRDETVVLGYDLLNEPLPNEWQHSHRDALAELYRELTAVIRAEDPNHLIVYEGAHWATNWELFTEVWDANSTLQFHKYWSSPDRASIAAFLEARDRLGLPIYMGEGGENSLDWLYTAFRLYEAHGIGWNLWPWKKLDTRTSPVSVARPAGWDRVVASIGGEAALGPAEARAVLDELLENVRVENARWQPDVVAAVTAVDPAVMPGWGFGFRGPGESSGAAPGTTPAGIREEDGVALTFAHPGGNPENPFEYADRRGYRDEELLVAELAAGEWLEFECESVGSLAGLRAVDAAGAEVDAEIARSDRGIRVTARTPLRLARVVAARHPAVGIVGAP